jgi:hypothetical protein
MNKIILENKIRKNIIKIDFSRKGRYKFRSNK